MKNSVCCILLSSVQFFFIFNTQARPGQPSEYSTNVIGDITNYQEQESKTLNIHDIKELNVWSGTVIDGIGIVTNEGDEQHIGGKGGDKSTISTYPLSKITVCLGEYSWGGKPIHNLLFEYSDGTEAICGNSKSCTDRKVIECNDDYQLSQIKAWTGKDGKLINAIQFAFTLVKKLQAD